MNKNILVVSNGHGEDIIGANLIEEILQRTKDVNIKVLPIVGKGKAYKSLPVELVGPRKVLPSGGFMRNSVQNFIADIKAGLLSLTYGQIKTLKKLRNKVDLVIPVGDVYVLLLARLFVGKKTIFLPTAKSEYINGHYWIEKIIMKKTTEVVFPRDEKTSKVLQASGVNAKFVGNAMMDCIKIKGVNFYLKNNANIVGILPGSREEAYDNMLNILSIIERIEKIYSTKMEYLTAMASNLTVKKLIKKVEQTNWLLKQPNRIEEKSGIYLKLKSPTGESVVRIIYSHFGDILDQADIFIGLAGTANEQAVGMGKPLVAFPGEGSQFTKKFAKAQKRLLGDSVLLVEKDPEKVASGIIKILRDKKLYQEMGRVGKQRMGKPGGIKEMVNVIINYLK